MNEAFLSKDSLAFPIPLPYNEIKGGKLMKKGILLLVALLSICLFGCGPKEPAKPMNALVTGDTPMPFDEKISFRFLSGAGAWTTEMTLAPDGSFFGHFHDSSMSEMGAGYPHGTVYLCDFEGRFLNLKQESDTSYALKLVQLKTKKKVGESWIEDKIRYVVSDPYGFDGDKKFTLYLPKTPTKTLPEAFLSWWPLRYEETRPETLSVYGIYNQAGEAGFFSDPQ